MIEKIERFFRELISAFQTAKLYTTKHPRFEKFLDTAYGSLQEILSEKEELVLGIVGSELAFEKEIFFELSKSVSSVIGFLKSRGAERIAFSQGVKKEELAKFIEFLALPKEEASQGIQEYLSSVGIKNISAGKMKVQGSSASSEDLQKALILSKIYEDSVNQVNHTMDAVLEQGDLEHLNLKFAINQFLENLFTKHNEVFMLSNIKRYEPGTFLHSMNVAVLAMYLSSRLGFARRNCLDIGIASLFHDIGKFYISRKILNKKGALTKEEFEKVRNHSALGAELLLKYVDSVGILPVVVAFEHHIKYDISGYPKLAFSRQLHVSSLIVALCDVYDALTLRRSYKSDYPPDLIYKIMSKERGSSFDPQLFDRFFEVMGVWPIGSIVSLTDQSVAYVKEQNENDIFLPKVMILSPQKTELCDLRQTKDRLKIEKFLNPWTEGKEFLVKIKEKEQRLTDKE